MWYKKAQQTINPQNVAPLDPNKNRQNIPSGGALEATLKGGDFSMGPNDPPKLVNVETDSGTSATIILLHGATDGTLLFPNESGQLHNGTVQEFDEWRKKQGWLGFGYIACNGNSMVASSGADVLIGATGAVNVGTSKSPDGTEKIIFSQ